MWFLSNFVKIIQQVHFGQLFFRLLAHMAYALLLVMMLNQSFLQFCICPQPLESFQQFSIHS